MAGLQIGDRAPTFRLPSAQGPIVDSSDFLGRSSLIVWFTKGFGCPYCRVQMSLLIRGLAKFRELGADLVMITRTAPTRARMYAERFPLTLPYLVDEDTAVRRAWGLDVRPKPVHWYLGKLMRIRHDELPPSDFGSSSMLGGPPGVWTSPSDFVKVLADEDTALFIVDRSGVIRFVNAGAMRANDGLGEVWQLPTTDEIIEVLKGLQRGDA